MARQTTNDNLRDLIKILGGTPKGSTTADLVDELEPLVLAAAAGTTPEQIAQAVETYISANTGGLSEAELDALFDE